jgi:hypothetical protein
MQVEYLHIGEALRAFAVATATQGQQHIRPFHQHVALRLVIEGGFFPDEITPHPPLRATWESGGWNLHYDAEQRTTSELTVFGGMKTKQVDVVVEKAGIGPVVGISVKGATGAYRNLVNRMEEAIGDSTNIHVMYPGFVYGFLSLIRCNRQSDGYEDNDVGVTEADEVSAPIRRYALALSEMTGRRFVRNDYTRYESVGLVLVENREPSLGSVNSAYPPPDSPLRVEPFFCRLFEVYDLRFPFRAERLGKAHRVTWNPASPLFGELAPAQGDCLESILGYRPRLAG